jgi:hypothetical protein
MKKLSVLKVRNILYVISSPAKTSELAGTERANATSAIKYFVVQTNYTAKCAVVDARPMDGKTVEVGSAHETFCAALTAMRAVRLCRTD